MKIKKNNGISLIEIIIVISLISIISGIVFLNLSDFHKNQILKNTTEDVISLLNEARNNTLSSKNSNSYGIHFEKDKVILFMGTSFFDAESNKTIDFDKSINIPETGGLNLTGGGVDIFFNRLTGDTTEYGTIIIQLKNDPTRENVITISPIGVIGID